MRRITPRWDSLIFLSSPECLAGGCRQHRCSDAPPSRSSSPGSLALNTRVLLAAARAPWLPGWVYVRAAPSSLTLESSPAALKGSRTCDMLEFQTFQQVLFIFFAAGAPPPPPLSKSPETLVAALLSGCSRRLRQTGVHDLPVDPLGSREGPLSLSSPGFWVGGEWG